MEKYVIALAGNPNVGKSTVFNALTGLRQHTGNWSGKTVSGASGNFTHEGAEFTIVDTAGVYSLRESAAEETEAADFIYFGGADAVVIVCDASCLERSLTLVLQAAECCKKVLVCVNLMDEAAKKGINVDTEKLGKVLGLPVVGTSARNGIGLEKLADELLKLVRSEGNEREFLRFAEDIETAVTEFSTMHIGDVENLPLRTLALHILCGDEHFIKKAEERFGLDINGSSSVNRLVSALSDKGWTAGKIKDTVISTEFQRSAETAAAVTECGKVSPYRRDRALDRIFLSRKTGIPAMLVLWGIIMWITVVLANYPSELLEKALFGIGRNLSALMLKASAPEWLEGALIQGVYRVSAWVVAVMLPPMAIFFPLFTLLEDFGYLPRIAFNLDPCFRCSGACGKQAVTMAMGFGCNACGVTGCRIIDSPRERLIAVLTNSFVPCNGRFPTIIAIITMFFVRGRGFVSSALSALMLLGIIMLAVGVTLLISKILTVTLLKGELSSFTLELPPYRRPQLGKILVRSMLDRTVFVLARACTAAAPCGLIIWLMANVKIGGGTLLTSAADFLEPFGQLLGMDGAIILGFVLGFPANEIVMPIIIMTYLSQGSLAAAADTSQLSEILTAHGWSFSTAVCMIIFVLFHFPCATTCMTIKKETGSLKYTLLSVFLPLATGIILCMAVNGVSVLADML